MPQENEFIISLMVGDPCLLSEHADNDQDPKKPYKVSHVTDLMIVEDIQETDGFLIIKLRRKDTNEFYNLALEDPNG